jgi:transposase
MRTGISITVKPSDRKRLKAILQNRNAPQKHAWRAEIILLSAEGLGTNEIMRRTKKSKTCVWRWQERFMEEGVEGLLRDKTRPSRIAPLGPEVADRVVAKTQEKPPGETTHWTRALMAEACGISASADLAGPRPSASQDQAVQALQRSEVRGEAARYRGALRRSAGSRHCPFGR